MIAVKYIAGNSGKEFILNQSYEIHIKECNPHSSEWTYESVEQQYGIRITKFTKDPIKLPVVFKFRGSEKTIGENLNDFFAECEKDVLAMKQGELWIGDEYIRGWFIARETNPSSEFYGYEQSATFLAPYPFYIRKLTKQFYPDDRSEESGNEDGLNYPYDYPYNYATDSAGNRSWIVDHYTDSEFKMTIYGPVTDPRINISGYPYQVFDTLERGEYMVIDSRENTITKYRNNNTTANIYDLRAKENSVFRKIPPGSLSVNWTGAFGFDITLFLERSEPRWR